ncbi:MAG: B12-binding domain-containing radical SAM protein [Planctomycetota bacterium]|jgi:radical SAM superfamily enzyme YgiQ (UPF0313 family)
MKKQRNVVLVHPPLSLETRYGDSKIYTSHIHPPQGLCHLASILPPSKYNVSIIDAQALFIGVEETVKKVEKLQPDYIGIITFTISINIIATLYSKIKKSVPKTKIILGGPHITACPDETLRRYPEFELAVLHEGELSFVDLLECLDQRGDLNNVEGIIYRSNGKIIRTKKRTRLAELEALPMPRWDLLPHLPEYYRPSQMTYLELPAVAVVASRGCPCTCTFCDRSVFGRRWRAHSPKQILSWVDYLVENYGIKDINFQDDHFMVNKKRLYSICKGIKEKHPRLLWSAIARTDSVDPETIALMKEAGCWQLAFGIESGCQQILNVLKKGITVEQTRQAVKLCKNTGMLVKGLFMAGCPTETKETLEKTAEFIDELDLDYLSMSAFTPTPNTEIYGQWAKYGRWEGAGPDDWHKMNLWEPIFIPHGLTKEYLKQFVKRTAL